MPPAPDHRDDDEVALVAAGGVLAALAVPMALAPVRDEVGQTNVALLLAGVVVVTGFRRRATGGDGGVGDRRAGLQLLPHRAVPDLHRRRRPRRRHPGPAAGGRRRRQRGGPPGPPGRAAGGGRPPERRPGRGDGLGADPRRRRRRGGADRGAGGRRGSRRHGGGRDPRRPGGAAPAHRDGCLDPVPGSRVRATAALHEGPVAFPIAFGDRAYGRVVVDARPGALTDDVVATVAILADQVALAVSRAESSAR